MANTWPWLMHQHHAPAQVQGLALTCAQTCHTQNSRNNIMIRTLHSRNMLAKISSQELPCNPRAAWQSSSPAACQEDHEDLWLPADLDAQGSSVLLAYCTNLLRGPKGRTNDKDPTNLLDSPVSWAFEPECRTYLRAQVEA